MTSSKFLVQKRYGNVGERRDDSVEVVNEYSQKRKPIILLHALIGVARFIDLSKIRRNGNDEVNSRALSVRSEISMRRLLITNIYAEVYSAAAISNLVLSLRACTHAFRH